MSKSWENDWTTFVAKISERVQSGESAESISSHFAGRSVTWIGRVAKIHLDSLAPRVSFSMPRLEVALGTFGSSTVGDLSIPVDERKSSHWKDVRQGFDVRFTATLGSGISPFPAIEIMKLSSGRTILMLRLCDAFSNSTEA